MRHVTAELREILEAVEIRPGSGFSVCGERIAISPHEAGSATAETRLADALYRRLYCRPEPGGSGRHRDGRAVRVFIDALSQANCGAGTWEPGWVVQAVESDGTLVVHRQRDDLTLWARPEQFRPRHGALAAGCVGRLRLGKELREMLPGYYTILGEADQADAPAAIVRFYWHLTADAACLWVRELTGRFNSAGVAFHAKLLSDPGAYLRADAGVLYVAHASLSGAMALLPDLHMAVSSQLRPTTPLFTRCLAPGLAVAEDPGDGRSFGQHRCRLVAEALVRAFEDGRTTPEDAAAAIAARFAEEGLSIARPWLGPGSQERYAWPAPCPQIEKPTGT